MSYGPSSLEKFLYASQLHARHYPGRAPGESSNNLQRGESMPESYIGAIVIIAIGKVPAYTK